MRKTKFVFLCYFTALSLFVNPSIAKAEVNEITAEELQEEMLYDDMEMIAQLVEAEAGNQDLEGKRFVVDVVLNRVDSDQFPNTVEEVIYEKNQFSVIKNGAFEKAGWAISDESFEAVRLEYEERTNSDILFFGTKKRSYMKHGSFKCQDHWFGW